MNPVFDSDQQKVIDISEGRHLVLAPPGCGKTAILAERVRRALERGVYPDEMLCLTFTNRAARGMEERVNALGTEGIGDVFVGNTHRFCGEYLFANNIVERTTEILDEETSFSIIEEILESHILPEATAAERKKLILRVYFLEHLMAQFQAKMPNKSIIYAVHHAHDGLRELCDELHLPHSGDSMVELYRLKFPEKLRNSPAHSVTITMLSLAKEYRDYKKKNKLIDFDDLLVRTYASLLHDYDPPTYEWIQVDEVQDLNPLQLAIIEALAAPRSNVVYLGDDQQAIFSFMGAKASTLRAIADDCEGNVSRLGNNYRSPAYILGMLNSYAALNLDMEEALLPKATREESVIENPLRIAYCRDTSTLPGLVAVTAKGFPTDGRTAIIVPTNKDADEISATLSLPHFKISGQDYFCSVETGMLLSLAMVAASDFSRIAWARLMFGAGCAGSLKAARKAVMSLFEAAVSPSDLLLYDEGSALTHFADCFSNDEKPVVIFDTETTGLDTAADDIVQLAAIKVLGGKIIDRFNVFLKTDREIPEMLGDIPNPVIQEMKNAPVSERREGLVSFLEFAGDAPLAGHNVGYDMAILRHNLRRDCNTELKKTLVFDTLHLTRLLFPGLFSFKLKDLLETFSLGGENSHLADDDIVATLSLARHICATFKGGIKERHIAMLGRVKDFRRKFSEKVGRLYGYAVEMRDSLVSVAPLAEFMNRFAKELVVNYKVNLDRNKTNYFIEYIRVNSSDEKEGLRENLEKWSGILQTLRESDLCDGDIVSEKIFVTTVHKAKGLEFENVIITNVTEGVYPFFYSGTPEEKKEDARKLYVALSRAKKRIVIAVPRLKLVPRKNSDSVMTFETEISPFIRNIKEHFVTQ